MGLKAHPKKLQVHNTDCYDHANYAPPCSGLGMLWQSFGLAQQHEGNDAELRLEINEWKHCA